MTLDFIRQTNNYCESYVAVISSALRNCFKKDDIHNSAHFDIGRLARPVGKPGCEFVSHQVSSQLYIYI